MWISNAQYVMMVSNEAAKDDQYEAPDDKDQWQRCKRLAILSKRKQRDTVHMYMYITIMYMYLLYMYMHVACMYIIGNLPSQG